jgi:hypothetical protein
MSEGAEVSGFIPPAIEDLNEWLSSYEFLDLIACGGMGAVYRARQVSLDRTVAIKILPPELAVDETFRASFEAEGKAMAKVTHSNLVGVYDFGEISDMLFLVMEFVEGSNLYESMSVGAIDAEVAVTLISAVASGLAEAHRNDLVHRDIKPANILISTEVVPKLGDFGLAVPDSDIESGLMMGTPAYLAPEVLADPSSASFASDTFALGVILYEMLTGSSIERGDVVDLAKVPNLGALPRIITKALDPKPLLRYQNAELFEADLKDWLRKPKSSVLAVSPVGAAMRPHLAPVVTSNSGGGGGGFFLVLLLLAALGGLGWMFFVRDSGKASDENLVINEAKEETPVLDLRPESPASLAPELEKDPTDQSMTLPGTPEVSPEEESSVNVLSERAERRRLRLKLAKEKEEAGGAFGFEKFTDPEVEDLTKKYRSALLSKIEALENGYLRVLGDLQEKYEKQGAETEVQQIKDEVSRAQALKWRGGFLSLEGIPEAGDLPSDVEAKRVVFRSEFEKRYEPIQSTYLSALEKILSRKKSEGVAEVAELERAIKFLKVPEGAVRARFVKIESLPDDGISNASISMIDILDGWGEKLAIEKFSDVEVSSYDFERKASRVQSARRALDGNPITFWKGLWSKDSSNFPYWLSFDLGEETWITGFQLTSRGAEFEKRHTDIKNWRFYVSLDGENWTAVAEGEFPEGPQKNEHVGFVKMSN